MLPETHYAAKLQPNTYKNITFLTFPINAERVWLCGASLGAGGRGGWGGGGGGGRWGGGVSRGESFGGRVACLDFHAALQPLTQLLS